MDHCFHEWDDVCHNKPAGFVAERTDLASFSRNAGVSSPSAIGRFAGGRFLGGHRPPRHDKKLSQPRIFWLPRVNPCAQELNTMNVLFPVRGRRRLYSEPGLLMNVPVPPLILKYLINKLPALGEQTQFFVSLKLSLSKSIQSICFLFCFFFVLEGFAPISGA